MCAFNNISFIWEEHENTTHWTSEPATARKVPVWSKQRDCTWCVYRREMIQRTTHNFGGTSPCLSKSDKPRFQLSTTAIVMTSRIEYFQAFL